MLMYELNMPMNELTLKVLVMTIDALELLDKIITPQWEGMGDVESVRYEPALPSQCLTKCFKLCTVSVRDPPTPFVSDVSEIQHFKG